jgi:hypothetical protein
MSPRHFANMYQQTSHRHDTISEYEQFEKDFGAICGMLYSVITLKAFFPKSPAPAMNNNPVSHAAGGDSKYTQLSLF